MTARVTTIAVLRMYLRAKNVGWVRSVGFDTVMDGNESLRLLPGSLQHSVCQTFFSASKSNLQIVLRRAGTLARSHDLDLPRAMSKAHSIILQKLHSLWHVLLSIRAYP